MEEKHWSNIFESWVSPSGVLLLVGGVVWGVQLNIATMNITAEMVTHSERLGKLEIETDDLSENVLRTTLILEAMELRMIDALEHVEDHNRESEDWKRRIVVLEELRRSTGD